MLLPVLMVRTTVPARIPRAALIRLRFPLRSVRCPLRRRLVPLRRSASAVDGVRMAVLLLRIRRVRRARLLHRRLLLLLLLLLLGADARVQGASHDDALPGGDATGRQVHVHHHLRADTTG